MDTKQKLNFASDYTRTSHPAILNRLTEIADESLPGYGSDPICDAAKEKIRSACDCPDADVFFLSGGTQMNAVVIDSILSSYQGVVAAETGHISVHESGAIEYGGHKVLTLAKSDSTGNNDLFLTKSNSSGNKDLSLTKSNSPGNKDLSLAKSYSPGKIAVEDLEHLARSYEEDPNHDHMVMPGIVYLSQPTEYGTLYSLKELTEIRQCCLRHNLALYVDGARLAYALASPENDVSLKDLARLTDAFYIGGTKCGAFIGEALVMPQRNYIPHFISIMKQHGALLAKGWLLGIQFDVLFTDSLYTKVGETAIAYASKIQDTLEELGIPLYFHSPTNQIFVILNPAQKTYLEDKVDMSFWEKLDDEHTVMRIATSWATTDAEVNELLEILTQCR